MIGAFGNVGSLVWKETEDLGGSWRFEMKKCGNVNVGILEYFLGKLL